MTSYRDDALARLDVRVFFAAQQVELLKMVGQKEQRFLCPFHGDTEPSANVNLESGLWHCKACGESGSPIDWLMKRNGMSYRDALEEVGRLAGMAPPSLAVNRGGHTNGAAADPEPASTTKSRLTETNVKAWHEAGLRNEDLQRWFAEHRGFTPETIAARQLGWDGYRVTIPVRDGSGKLVNVRRYKRDSGGETGKMLPLVPGEAATQLYPLVDPLPPDVILVEGEWDAILMQQEGFPNTLTVTAGAGIWKPWMTPLFEGRTVTLIPDNDEAGRNGSAKIAKILANVTPATFILQIPNLPQKGDVTDFFVEQQRSADELRSLIADATPYVVAPTAVDEGEALRTPLHKASDAALRGKRLELPVLLSGKAMTPYTVPNEMKVTCDMSNKRFCAVCPMQEVAGSREVKLTASDPAVLSLIGVTTQAQYSAIKALAKAVPQCNRPQVEILSSINIEELRLIPELDAGTGDGEVEYVSRQGFFLGHGLLPNRSYAMRGYTHPSPKTQATVHLLSEAEPSQDNISAFAMTPELREQLTVFQGQPEERFEAIYDDFADSVHRIRDRFDMQIAFDLVWHSVIGFYFNGAFVRRGWVEAMVMGDSGQGKTEMADTLRLHYGLGYRLPAEQTSMAGLIGGLEKMGDTWMLGWGAIPLNDKRLLVIDEAQGLHPSAIEGMSDVRASGVAEITKIRTERTNARCRLVWLANPTSGLTLAQHNQGVLAIKELFKKPEDVRRLDVAMCVASGDVDVEGAINVRHNATAEIRYGSDLCRSLVLWAWSRRADQVTFTEPATDAILAAATAMGKRYHSSIPLVEPSDQRLKLARLATAAAARTFSTEDGETLIVRKEHVTFVVDFLERVYSSPAMAYDEYSASMARGEQLGDEEEQEVRDFIDDWHNREEAVEFFRTAQTFRKVDLTDGVGWDDQYAKLQLRMLQGKRLIRPTRTGYYKAPAFIILLRAIGEKKAPPVEAEPDYEGAPF